MKRQGVLVILIGVLFGAGTVGAQDRAWPSAPFRGEAPDNPPCSCRAPGVEAEVGQDVCLATPTGGRRARCIMVQNNTSWAFGPEPCGAIASLR
ncbi:hypothetical protein [uncultured Enterovirga sp.]|uniref:hypothetical protein n=1 Tax=uncultured Enterovirga sp. TaxID=2026352 RepID=UPI0035CA3ED7